MEALLSSQLGLVQPQASLKEKCECDSGMESFYPASPYNENADHEGKGVYIDKKINIYSLLPQTFDVLCCVYLITNRTQFETNTI